MTRLPAPSAPLRCASLVLALHAALLLSACGGDSGSSSNNAGSSPVVTPTPTPVSGSTPTPTPTLDGTPTPTPTPAPGVAAAPSGPTAFDAINTMNRAEVTARFWDSLTPLRQTAFTWTGSVSGCNPGDTTLDYKNAEVKLLNYFRAMAQLPSNVSLSLPESALAQKTALMMDANSAVDHNPPSSWTCYSADGASTAGKSNLAFGSPKLNGGIGALGLYITDGNEATLGHRRWMLYSRLATVGAGDTLRANALYVLGNDGAAFIPANGTPWPPAGFVPVDDRVATPSLPWSFSYPDADFSAASVTLTDDANNPIVLTNVGPLADGYGDKALGWTISTGASGWNRYPGDTRINVSISNVLINNVARNFSYSVTFIQP